jgi:hypothetical protein
MAFLSANAAFAQADKATDLPAGVKELEKRVAELEQTNKELRASQPWGYVKDSLTLIISMSALVVALVALLQKSSETKRMIRALVADIVSKLISAETEIRKLNDEIDNAKPGEDTTGRRSIRNTVSQQRATLARQAHYLIPLVPNLVSDIEYAAMARAFAADDADLADTYWNRAIDGSKGFGQGKHRRSYAQFLFSNITPLDF